MLKLVTDYGKPSNSSYMSTKSVTFLKTGALNNSNTKLKFEQTGD